MKIIVIVSILIIIFGVFTYPKWSITECYKKSEINAKHPDWTPNCGIDFLKKDPQWFIDNGYEKYVS